jgi:pimeloyl-ACP methyl ester carboxylesterase
VTTKKPGTETGMFLGEFPYVRLGNGPDNLVILPGITLENEPPNRLAAWTYRPGFRRFAEGHTVYVINRRRDMPSGYTTQDMAADYARVMEEELGPSRVMGFSTGGSIAQYVALDQPEPNRQRTKRRRWLATNHSTTIRSPSGPMKRPG